MHTDAGPSDHIPGTEQPGADLAGYSLTAILAFAFSLMSLAICLGATLVGAFVTPAALVVILGLPLLGLAAAVLGAAAASSIKRSPLPIGGRRLAVFALFVGLGSAIIQGSFAVSAVASFWSIKTVLAPRIEPLFEQGVNADDAGPMRAALSQGAGVRAPDGRVASFFGALEGELGAFEQAGVGVDIFFDLRSRVGAAPPTQAQPPLNQPKPLGLTFANQRVTSYFFLDQDALSRGDVVVDDILVFLADGRALALTTGGDAEKLATFLGTQLANP